MIIKRVPRQKVTLDQVITDNPTEIDQEKILAAYFLGDGKYADRTIRFSELAKDLKLSFNQALSIVKRYSKKYGLQIHSSMVLEYAFDIVKDCIAELQSNKQLQIGIVQMIAGNAQELLNRQGKDVDQHKLEIVLEGMKQLPALITATNGSFKTLNDILTNYGKLSGLGQESPQINFNQSNMQQNTQVNLTIKEIGEMVDGVVREKFQNPRLIEKRNSERQIEAGCNGNEDDTESA